MLFRPIRTLVLILITFTAGVFFERSAARDACLDAGGAMRDSICTGVRP